MDYNLDNESFDNSSQQLMEHTQQAPFALSLDLLELEAQKAFSEIILPMADSLATDAIRRLDPVNHLAVDDVFDNADMPVILDLCEQPTEEESRNQSQPFMWTYKPPFFSRYENCIDDFTFDNNSKSEPSLLAHETLKRGKSGRKSGGG